MIIISTNEWVLNGPEFYLQRDLIEWKFPIIQNGTFWETLAVASACDKTVCVCVCGGQRVLLDDSFHDWCLLDFRSIFLWLIFACICSMVFFLYADRDFDRTKSTNAENFLTSATASTTGDHIYSISSLPNSNASSLTSTNFFSQRRRYANFWIIQIRYVIPNAKLW